VGRSRSRCRAEIVGQIVAEEGDKRRIESCRCFSFPKIARRGPARYLHDRPIGKDPSSRFLLVRINPAYDKEQLRLYVDALAVENIYLSAFRLL